MTYATIKNGVFLLFEYNEKDYSGDQWKENDSWIKASETAIVANDQSLIWGIVRDKDLSKDFEKNNIWNFAIEGYRIKVKELLDITVNDQGEEVYKWNKTATLIKQYE